MASAWIESCTGAVVRWRVLVVDDEEAIRFAIGDYLGGLGFSVDCAQELGEAEAMLSQSAYDLIILDLRLTGHGGTEGLDILQHVRERGRSTPVILLTAYGSPEVESEARRRGADVVVEKPMPLPKLAQIAFTLLEPL